MLNLEALWQLLDRSPSPKSAPEPARTGEESDFIGEELPQVNPSEKSDPDEALRQEILKAQNESSVPLLGS